MSRGFVKEDNQEEAPFIPQRAPLPDGVTNYVTPRGMRLLLEEREHLEAERAGVMGSESERRREQAAIDGCLALLNERIVTARPVEPTADRPAEVRFGTAVTVFFQSGPQRGQERVITITGVDEANTAELRISFTSPLARALLGNASGARVQLKTGAMTQEVEVRAIRWADQALE